MILPTKHITPAQSLLGVGALLLERLERAQSVSDLWEQVRSYSEVGTFQRYILALDLLFTLDAIDIRRGMIRRRA